jgi:hypothetical protein
MEINNPYYAHGLEVAVGPGPAQLSGLANPGLKPMPETGERSWHAAGRRPGRSGLLAASPVGEMAASTTAVRWTDFGVWRGTRAHCERRSTEAALGGGGTRRRRGLEVESTCERCSVGAELVAVAAGSEGGRRWLPTVRSSRQRKADGVDIFGEGFAAPSA